MYVPNSDPSNRGSPVGRTGLERLAHIPACWSQIGELGDSSTICCCALTAWQRPTARGGPGTRLCMGAPSAQAQLPEKL
jgi:hypothetical protein